LAEEVLVIAINAGNETAKVSIHPSWRSLAAASASEPNQVLFTYGSNEVNWSGEAAQRSLSFTLAPRCGLILG
jgi:hypothetical protein